MFSGIIEALGEVKAVSKRAGLTLLEISAWGQRPNCGRCPQEPLEIGESIAVNGVCLTLIKHKDGILSFEVMPQTLKITNLGMLSPGKKVNLERALKVGERISGHFVTGHIDCVAVIRNKNYRDGSLSFEIAAPQEFSRYIIPQGSVALDGTSLTIANKKANVFSVCIIPHTLKNTTLGFKGPSDKVNIEFDILAKKSA